MFSLFKIIVSGFKMLEDNFTLDLLSKARVKDEDLGNEVYRICDKLYSYNIIAFTGSNSSGKTTVLELLDLCCYFIKKGRWPYFPDPFSKDKISLHLEFSLDNKFFIYDGVINNKTDISDNEDFTPYCDIDYEVLKIAQSSSNITKTNYKDLNYEEIENKNKNIKDTSILASIEGLDCYKDFVYPYNTRMYQKRFFDNLSLINEHLLMSIIHLLDESIEYIKYKEDKTILFKRYNSNEILLSKYGLLSILSNGTIKGIDLYIRTINVLKYGGILIVDEIENCFHKNLVNNILFLFTDKSININNAKIIFSTHYVEILDIFNRRDNIFILHKDNSTINVKNMYENYNIRTELLKSKQFNNNIFNTLLNYENLMILKRGIKNEILDNIETHTH